ncbi:MAG TPA: phosphotransferase [Streptosporangiaceae bacterium]|nr:phosphotransferase [Streptosporangiaceae bacterium]
MSPVYAPAADYAGVFAHFGAEQVPEQSSYPWSPVFPCQVGGRPAVIKRTRGAPADASAVAAATRAWSAGGIAVVTPIELDVANPVRLGDLHWVAYPFIEGSVYTGQLQEIDAAGTLLGRMHACDAAPALMPAFRWPDYDQERIDEDVDLLNNVAGPYIYAQVLKRLVKLVPRFTAELLPPIRDGNLPCANTSMDYKASNLIYTSAGPVLVDPDNGDHAPRLLDLAQAALLFHTDHEPAPARPFDSTEWAAFIRAYQREIQFTDDERKLWPTAIEYMLAEEGHWAFTGTPEDWERPRQRSFLLALANVHADDFPLS